MNKLLVLMALCVSANVSASQPKVVYGDDNRIDIVDSRDLMRKKLSLSTATQIKDMNLTLSKDKTTYTLKNETLQDFMLMITRNWWSPDGVPLCEGEKFEKQLAIGNCSGFLVGDKYLVTAGHCMTSQSDCTDTKWAFNYRKGEVEDLELEASEVYSCKAIVSQELSYLTMMDYAIIELDRVVKNRDSLEYRKEGKIQVGEGLFMIGSPSGLPIKITGDSTVYENNESVYFKADIDAFGGNSGSAVFNARSGEVEGILVRGARDYQTYTKQDNFGYKYECNGVSYCEDGATSGLCGGESITRITEVDIETIISEYEESQLTKKD